MLLAFALPSKVIVSGASCRTPQFYISMLMFPLLLLPCMSRLSKRLDRLGTLAEVRKVFADTCCEGKADVSRHVCVDLFPNVTRAPFADLFHKVQILSTHTLSSHPLHPDFTR